MVKVALPTETLIWLGGSELGKMQLLPQVFGLWNGKTCETIHLVQGSWELLSGEHSVIMFKIA